jgi:hypothetical protein
MTNEEFIDKLQKLDPKAEVFKWYEICEDLDSFNAYDRVDEVSISDGKIIIY